MVAGRRQLLKPRKTLWKWKFFARTLIFLI
jgi:hypothetical protein